MNNSQFKLQEIKIEVTHDCLLHCIHCSSASKANSKRSMGWQSCEQILDEAVAMGVKEVAFSGGEPLLWEHIQKAVERASKHKMEIFLYTTGNVPHAQDRSSQLFSVGLKNITFSLFGANEQQHERVTAQKGSYRKTLKIANHCQSIGMDIEFHFVPFSHNYTALPEIAKKTRELGARRISLLRLVPQGRGEKEKNGQLSHSQNLELRKIVKTLRNVGHDIRLGSPYNFLLLRKRQPCKAGINRLTVGPDLSLFPCDAFKHISPEDIGVSSDFSNLREYSLRKCWEKSPYLRTVRNHSTTSIATECKSCRKLESCLSGCIAQKFYTWGELRKRPDPMCLLGHQIEIKKLET